VVATITRDHRGRGGGIELRTRFGQIAIKAWLLGNLRAGAAAECQAEQQCERTKRRHRLELRIGVSVRDFIAERGRMVSLEASLDAGVGGKARRADRTTLPSERRRLRHPVIR